MKKKSKFTDKEIELALANVKASFAMEEMYFTDEETEVLRRFGKGEITEEEALKKIQKV